MRGKFIGIGKGGTSYVDLFCGPGKLLDRQSGQFVDGSAIVAALAARESGHPFDDIYLADLDPAAVLASARRLVARGITARIHEYVGPAEHTAPRVVRDLGLHALHLAFLDPYNLGDLPFSVIRALAALKRPDLLIHVSAMDLQRNLTHAIRARGDHAFDIFAPGWRDAVNLKQPQRKIRQAFLDYWLGRIRQEELRVFGDSFELVTGPRNQRLYWLALAAKHDRAEEFWGKIRHVDPQRKLQL